jgi:DNA-binding response OmpR family regulator
MKILLVEDDKHIHSFLTRGFQEDDIIFDSAICGDDGEYLASTNTYDLIILDWMLPEMSGIEILESIRDKGISTPVIMLTAKSMLEDKLKGLRVGADDYLTKPFEYDELIARMEALYRRSINNGQNTIQIKDLVVDLNAKIVFKDNIALNLSSKEYELLAFFIKNKNCYITSSMIEDQLWNNESFISSNVISVTMHNLRKKIGKDTIINSRGLGYKLEI